MFKIKRIHEHEHKLLNTLGLNTGCSRISSSISNTDQVSETATASQKGSGSDDTVPDKCLRHPNEFRLVPFIASAIKMTTPTTTASIKKKQHTKMSLHDDTNVNADNKRNISPL